MAGDFILAVASMMIARLRDNDVTLTLSQVIFTNSWSAYSIEFLFELGAGQM